MKYLNSYKLFMENKSSEVDIENLEKDLKKKGIDPNDEEFQQKLAKNLTDQLKKQIDSKNPDIKVDLEEVVKESLDNKIFEGHGLIASVEHVEHVIHGFEQYFSDAESAEIMGGDVKHIADSMSKKDSGLWGIFKKTLKAIFKVGGFIMGWVETVIIWFCNTILGFSLETSAKTAKWIFIAIAGVALICFIIVFGAKALALAASGGILALFTKILMAGPKLLIKKSVIGNIWKGIRGILSVKGISENEDIITLPELISYIAVVKKDKSPTEFDKFISMINQKSTGLSSTLNATKKLVTLYQKNDEDDFENFKEVFELFAKSGSVNLARVMQRSIHWQGHLKDEHVEELSTIIKSILSDKNKLKKVPFINKLAGLSDKDYNIEDLFKYLETRLKINISSDESSTKKNIISDIFNGDDGYKKSSSKKQAIKLYKSMKGMGTREEDLFNVFKNISEKDFFAIYLGFNLQKNKDLIEWLFGDLSSKELTDLSNILDKVKWTDGYNIPNILRGSIDDYHKNKPKWSLSKY